MLDTYIREKTTKKYINLVILLLFVLAIIASINQIIPTDDGKGDTFLPGMLILGPVLVFLCLLLNTIHSLATKKIDNLGNHAAKIMTAFITVMLMITVTMFAMMYGYCGLQDVSMKLKVEPFDRLYFSAITLCTVGYGDIVPASQTARAYAAIEALFGYFILAIAVAAMVRQASKDVVVARPHTLSTGDSAASEAKPAA